MWDKKYEAIRHHLLNIVMALAAIIGGGLFVSMDHAGYQMFGTVLSALGGALLAKSLEDPTEAERKLEGRLKSLLSEQKSRLAPINRHLASVAKEVLSVVRRNPYTKDAAIENLRLVHQQVQPLIGVITDIADITGEKFDPNIIFQTASQVEELATLLDGLSRKSKTPQERETIEKAQSKLAEIHPDVYKRVEEKVACPSCGSKCSVMIGLAPPASASPNCASCGQAFHAHRKHGGTIEASRPGQSRKKAATRQVKVNCTCGSIWDAWVPNGSSTDRVCRSCGTLVHIGETGDPTVTAEKRIAEHVLQNLKQMPNGKYECPEHKRLLKLQLVDNGVFHAYCSAGPHVLRVSDHNG